MLLARLDSLIYDETITKPPSKKLTALLPGDVAADAQMAKGSPGRAGASELGRYLGIKVP
jgi:hypothetical protein